MDNYIAFVSYRDDKNEIVRIEATGTFLECVGHLLDFEDMKVISAEVTRPGKN